MAATLKAPSARPAQGFSSERAQRWIMAAAIVTGMAYALRLFVEPGMSSAPARGNKAQRLAGAGSPPPSLSHWLTSYGTAFMLLTLISLPAPELAASFAMLLVAGTLLANGTSITADLAGLEGASAAPTTAPTVKSVPASRVPPNPPGYPQPSQLGGE